MSDFSNKAVSYLRLVRFANVFTAVADPMAGWIIIGGGSPASDLARLLFASAALYLSGMVLNDCFDYKLDCRERPERPLPRGEIALHTAWTLGIVLMIAGLVSAAFVSKVALAIAGFIAVMIIFYDAWGKLFTGLGPLILGTCRFANFLLGMRCCPPRLWIAPAVLGVYVTSLTLVSRNEAVNPSLRLTVKKLLLGIIVVDALSVLVITHDKIDALLVLALILPAYVLSKALPMT